VCSSSSSSSSSHSSSSSSSSWSLTLTEGYRLGMTENEVPRKIFGPKK
jgi:hypothetical protein